MENTDLTQENLVELTGLSQGTISNYESGATLPPKGVAEDLGGYVKANLMPAWYEAKKERKKAKQQRQPERKSPSKRRSAKEDSGVRLIQIAGRVAAGEPTEAIAGDFGEVEIAESWLTDIKNPKALRVIGDSMKDMHILDGDVVVIDIDNHDYQNRIVAAYVISGADWAITLKRWKQKGGKIELQPANPDHSTRTYTNKSKVTLQAFGVMFKILRTYDYSKSLERESSKGDIEDDLSMV